MGLFDFWKKPLKKEKTAGTSRRKKKKAKGKTAPGPAKKSTAKKSRKKAAKPKAKGAKLKTAGKPSKSRTKKTRTGTTKKKYSLRSPAAAAKKTSKPPKVHPRPSSAGRPDKEKEIGVVTHYFGKISVGVLKLKSRLSVGQKIHVKGAHDDFYQAVTSMQINYENIDSAGKGQEVGIKLKKAVHRNDKVYSVPE